MPKNAAVKNAARARQAETGESYADARAAVVAEHGKPIYIQVELPEVELDGFTLDTPEARKAWRDLDKTDTEAIEDFAQEYLDDGLVEMGASMLEGAIFGGSGVAIFETEGPDAVGPQFPGKGYDGDGEWMSEMLGRTVTAEQAEWLQKNYDGPETEDGEVVPEALAQVATHLPADLATSAILARYAEGLAAFDPSAVKYSRPQSLLVSAIARGMPFGSSLEFTTGGPAEMDPAGRWPVELYRIRAIMRSATAAGDVAVLHECVNILTSWLHKLADWSVSQPTYVG